MKEDKTVRVVGINYQLAEEPEAIGKLVRETGHVTRNGKAVPHKPAPKPKAEPKPKPQLKQYNVVVRRIATLETAIDLRAADEAKARDLALEKFKRKRFELSKAVVKDEILGVSS